MQTDSSSPVAASGNTDAAEQFTDALNELEVVNPPAPLRDTAAIAAQSEQQPDIPADPIASDHVCQLLPSDLVRIALPEHRHGRSCSMCTRATIHADQIVIAIS